ncbi:MAG: thiamine pyrophosphate-dependent enzyme [Waddliaceae bacterium]
MSIPTICHLNEKGNLSRSCRHRIAHLILVEGYQTMVLTQHIDERMITLQRQGIITFALSSRGEEACAVASEAALKIKAS